VASTVLGGRGGGGGKPEHWHALGLLSGFAPSPSPAEAEQEGRIVCSSWSYGFLTCSPFQGNSSGHEVFFPSVGVVWLEWSYSRSNKGYF